MRIGVSHVRTLAKFFLLMPLIVVSCVHPSIKRVDRGGNVASVTVPKFTPGPNRANWSSMSVTFSAQQSSQVVLKKSHGLVDFLTDTNGASGLDLQSIPYGDYWINLEFFDQRNAVIYRSCDSDRQTLRKINTSTYALRVAICDTKNQPVSVIGADAVQQQKGRAKVTWLTVSGVKLLGDGGAPVVLRGMSTHGLQWFGQFANPSAVKWIRDDWQMSLIRAAMMTAPNENGYIANKGLADTVTKLVDSAIELGMYAMIDWHILSDNNPNIYKTEAIAFFTDMAKRYGNTPNVIFEICNEPNGDVTWQRDIKPYAQELVGVIRRYAPKNIIIVGTPTWSQDVDIVAESPLTGTNIMYALHFYAGTHKQDLRNKADQALAKGLPLFVTEWGVSDASGGGGVFTEEANRWLDFLAKRQISWVNWNLSDKSESSSALMPGAKPTGSWTPQDLSESGRFVRDAATK